jgi:RsmE family RNA methyltransferase
MNLILLFPDDFIDAARVRLTGRRLEHVREVHRANEGDVLTIGVVDGKFGMGTVARIDRESLEMDVVLVDEPPPPAPLTLVLALPRPKVLNRVIVAAASLGIKQIHLVNAWRVEKSYWETPRLSEENLRAQAILGLEQSRDTRMLRIETHRFFREFAEERLPSIAEGSLNLVAHPHAAVRCPTAVDRNVTLAIGPEGGWIEAELGSLTRAGFEAVSVGPRILRVETAVPFLVARLFR